jgi:hypothetical protein
MLEKRGQNIHFTWAEISKAMNTRLDCIKQVNN